jgi:hypothetical protein
LRLGAQGLSFKSVRSDAPKLRSLNQSFPGDTDSA